MTDDPEPHNPDQLLSAHLALHAAIDQLVQPGTEPITRADPILDNTMAQTYNDDRTTDRELAARHTRHLRAGHHAQARRTLAQLIDHRRRVQQWRDRVHVVAGSVPSLLAQLRSEVGASSNTGAGGAAGPYRSIIAIPAAELLAHIERTARQTPTPCHPNLTEQIRRWAAAPPHPVQAADTATKWVEQIRTMLNPPKRWHHPGACPDCGHRIAHVTDDSGETVRRPAIEFDRERGRARCLRCPAHWDTEPQLRQLARVLLDPDES